MRKIIDGKLYDTSKAKLVGFWDNGRGSSSNDYECCSLYRKRTGEFFIYGEGGPASRYAEPCGCDTWASGERIMPLTYDRARRWAERHLEVDEYAAAFGMPSEGEDDGSVQLSVRIPAAAKAALADEAARRGMTQGALVTELIMGARS